MTHYGFIEVGTSDFASLTTQKCYRDSLGISVEPVTKLIERLPINKNHIKVNKAIDITSGEKDFYKYIDEYIDLPPNSGKKNDYERGMRSQLIEEHNIASVDYLKIDTEGMDAYLLIELHKTVLRPHKIKFEYCHHSTEVVKEIIDLFKEYEIEKQTKCDIYLTIT